MRKKAVISYDPNLKELARKLRNNSTVSEVLLWRALKGKQIMGYDFDRQRPIDNYIVDFYCKKLKLAIEIDGSTHDDKIEEDRKRQARLESLGVRFLRFGDADVKRNLEGVVAEIRKWVEENEPTPAPPPEGNQRGESTPKEGSTRPFPSEEGI